MKFLASLYGGMLASILIILSLSLVFKCEHTDRVKLFSFQSENSTAMHYVKTTCEDCNQRFSSTVFRDIAPDDSYIGVLKEYTEDKKFVSGEYDTIRAKVTLADYDSPKTKIRCSVQQENIIVSFSVEFKNEFENAVSLLKEGDEITFYGKSSTTGLSWTNCELVTE